MPKGPKILAIVMGLVFLSSAATLAYWRYREANPPQAASTTSDSDPGEVSANAAGLTIPPFSLSTQDGGTFTEKDLLGRITIVDFIFTHCPFICPTLTERMSGLADRLKGTGVRFLSMSVDPAHDTPATLKAYASKHNADLSRWTMGVGTQTTVDSVLKDGLNFLIQEDRQVPITLPGGGTMNNIVHPSWFLLVGADGRALGVYLSSSPEDLAALEARARALDKRLKK